MDKIVLWTSAAFSAVGLVFAHSAIAVLVLGNPPGTEPPLRNGAAITALTIAAAIVGAVGATLGRRAVTTTIESFGKSATLAFGVLSLLLGTAAVATVGAAALAGMTSDANRVLYWVAGLLLMAAVLSAATAWMRWNEAVGASVIGRMTLVAFLFFFPLGTVSAVALFFLCGRVDRLHARGS